ncbi:hypothetical protein D9619_010837 [Psilocybe cf. subviscida]|uniref:glutathione transferase n=1 Tax=Psilocybe cf. subviscida TaxID=2480587 RepID=A0A8H5B8Q3_9AGAR|nr:hypothetical protein D9619_010837 [Psilocybe cf. subviscida]
MLTLHYLKDSRAQRILWLLEELNVPYEIKKYTRGPQGQAPAELEAINPLGKSPVITDDSVTLSESGAIVEYIIGKYGNGKAVPPESGRVDNTYFTHYAEGSLMPLLVQKFIFGMIPQHSPFYIRPLLNMVFGQLDRKLVVPEGKKHMQMIEAHLAKSKSIFFAGGDEPSAADYMMAFPLEAILTEAPEMAGPKVREYVETVQARPAYKKALEAGGEYAYARS